MITVPDSDIKYEQNEELILKQIGTSSGDIAHGNK